MDAEYEVVSLRAKLALAEEERCDLRSRLADALKGWNDAERERDEARADSAATKAALDEAVGLMHEAEGLLRVTYFTPNEKVDAINRWRTGCAAFLAAHAARRRRASPMPDHVIGEALVHELRVELNDARCALEAVLLFHSGGDWTDEKRERWLELTGNDFATTRSLCDFIRRVVGVPVLLEAEVKTFRTFDDLTAHVRALCFAAREPVRAHARRVHAFFAENPGARRFTDDDVEYVVEER